jgi:hypothetical protein
MLKIAHRINSVQQLKNVPKDQGIELDIRAFENHLILHHDPFEKGELFEDLLKSYQHKFIILNTKCEGMEEAILELLAKYRITEYFFLDLSLPYLVKYANKGLKEIAIRYSEFEPIEFALAFAGKVDWVWVDCFTHLPLDDLSYQALKKHFKICIVSPELQGYGLNMIDTFKTQIADMQIDAVCTKRPDLW